MTAQSIEIISGSDLISALPVNDALVRQSSFFQSASWISLWDAQFGFTVNAVAASEDGVIVGYMPFCTRSRLGMTECYSMPVGTYGGAVVLDNDSDRAGSIKQFFLDSCHKKGYARVNVVEFEPELDPLFDGFDIRKLTTYILTLDADEESLLSAMSESHRRNIRKYSDGDFECRRVATADDVRAYYSLVEDSARRHKTEPFFSIEFYESMLEQISEECILWELVSYDGIPCAGHIYFRWADGAFYWDGASNQTGLDQRANYYLFWKNIRRFAEERVTTLNFGASPEGADDLVRFKRGWGAKGATYFEYDKSSAVYRGMRHFKDWLR